MRLRISDDFTLPIEAATQTFLVVGKRNSGKSNTCVRLAEQFFAAGVPFVAIDPVDNWWGLKSSSDGKGPGLSIYVFGGRHADLPLEAGAGSMIADVLVDHRISAVLSIKHLSGRERGRFVADLAHRLFQKNTEPLHVFLEEAHEVAPQSPFKGEEEMLGHVNRIWKLGRSSGLGGSAITQRPASLSKNITTQAEILVVHRMIGPQDVAAIREWIKYHGEREDILAELSTLKTGEAFIWAPDFPEGRPIGLKRVTMLRRETYDSAATPKAGEKRAEPKALAPVDLERLRTKMAATIEKAKAEDPKTLRAEVARLKAELARAQTTAPVAREPKERRVEVPVLKDQQLARLETLAGRYERLAEGFVALGEPITETIEVIRQGLTRLREPVKPTPPSPSAWGAKFESLGRPGPVAPPRPTSAPRGVPYVGARLPEGERLILTAAAQYPEGVTREQASILTGYKRSTRDAYIQRLGGAGRLVVQGDRIVATQDGVDALGQDFQPLPVGDELRAYWLARLPEGERRVLDVMIGGFPKPVDREHITEVTEYKRSTRDAYIQRLKARKLVVIERGMVRASEELFG